jgi:hypothetical protein
MRLLGCSRDWLATHPSTDIPGPPCVHVEYGLTHLASLKQGLQA